MTVADNTSRNQYSATSGQTVFAYTFEIVDKSHIVVLKNGVALSEGTNYSVSNVGNDSGGNVTLTVGATTGDVLTLYRDMPYSRTQNYTNSGDFLASEVNSDFDDLWLAGEQTDRSFSQSIRKPITDSDSISMELPEAATRANKFIKFDANGAVDLAAGVTTDVDAEDVSIEDAGGYYTSDNVEGALQEIGAQPPGFDPNTDSFNIGSDAVSSGTDSIALGHDASATAARDIALGLDAVASGGGSIAIGQETDSTGVRSIAIGKGAQSTLSTSIAIGEDASTLNGAGGGPVAIGYSALSTGISGISLGGNATASGSRSVSIGDTATSSGPDSIAIGRQLTTTGANAIGIGYGAEANNENAIAIGRLAATGNVGSTVIGYSATSDVNNINGVAIGYGATANQIASVAIGNNATSNSQFGTALGRDSNADSGSYATALGYSSEAATYATAVGGNADATGANSTAVGYGSNASNNGTVALGNSAQALNLQAISIGQNASSLGSNNIAIGNAPTTTGVSSIAIGTSANASGGTSISIGADSEATVAGSIAVGKSASATGLGVPIAIGRDTESSGAYGISMGEAAIASGAQTLAIGYGAEANNDNGIAIGRQLTVAGQKAIGIGWGAVAGNVDSIGIGTSANALNTYSISIGVTSQALSAGGVAIGGGAITSASNTYGVAIGYAAQANDVGGIAIGNNAIVSNTGTFGTAIGRDSLADNGPYGTALGYNSTAYFYATALGSNTDATGNYSTAIGYGADSLGEDAIALGHFAGADADNTIHINASGVNTNQPQTAGHIVIETDDASLTYDGTWSLAGGALSTDGLDVTGDVAFGDNDKAIFGAGSDLQIYHSGATSFITENGTGDLRIGANNLLLRSDDIFVQSEDGTANAARFNATTGVTLYRAGVAKLDTTTTGIDVTGTATTDGLLSQDTSKAVKFTGFKSNGVGDSGSNAHGEIVLGATSAYQGIITYNGTEGDMYFENTWDDASALTHITFDDKKVLTAQGNGDISFYEDTGSTPKFHWDAADEALGIGTTNPRQDLEIFNGDTGSGIRLAATATAYWDIERDPTSGHLTFTDDGAGTVLTVGQNGLVGIGTDSPDHILCLEDAEPTLRIFDADNTLNQEQTIAFGTEPGDRTHAEIAGINANTGNAAGDLSFKTNGGSSVTERMRITSDGLVGIATDSPAQPLHVDLNGRSTAYKYLQLDGDGGLGSVSGQAGVGFRPIGAGNNVHASINALEDGLASYKTELTFNVNKVNTDSAPTEAMRISSDGSVNITNASSATFSIQGGDGNSKNIVFKKTTGGAQQAKIQAVGDDLRFITGSGTDEAFRVDSSQNLLVGTTDSSVYNNNTNTSADNGINLMADGKLYATKSGASVAIFNRTSSDGNIVEFNKSGSIVGAVGVNGSNNLNIGGSVANHAGLEFVDTAYYPQVAQASSNGDVDLGGLSRRFKDLYLSGGVVFGATGGNVSSKTLDDYEEGTWTPIINRETTSPSVTYGTQTGRYTKIGRFVHATFLIQITGFTNSGSGRTKVGGLPFSSVASEAPGGSFYRLDGINTTATGQFTSQLTGGTEFRIVDLESDGGVTLIEAAPATGYVIGQVIYEAS